MKKWLCLIVLLIPSLALAQSTTPGTPVIAGVARQIPSTLTVSASSYSSGQSIGGLQQITVALYPGQTGFVISFRTIFISGAAATIVPYIFDSQPTASTCNNGVSFSMGAADIAKLIIVPSSIITSSPVGMTPAIASIDFVPPRPFVSGGSLTPTSATIWYCLVAASTVIPTTTTDVRTNIGIMLN